MERIIISEIDNTSNVESLSSYDVVYVPGFANNDASPLFSNGATLYRTPTLVTTKYDFLRLFGDTCPTFPKDQPYPIATETKWGFPKYAIPNYVPSVDPIEVERLNNFTATGNTRQEIIDAVVVQGNINYYDYVKSAESSGWTPSEGVTYYVATCTNNIVTMGPLPQADDFSEYVIFTSNISPVAEDWYEYIGEELVLTSDDEIEFDASTGQVQRYYEAQNGGLSLMFKGPTATSNGDADPGYRYALYLLSVGIPVYYEQMNANFILVDKNNLSIWKEDELGNVSPVLNGWYEPIGSTYIRTTDTSIQEDKDYYVGAEISIQSMYEGLEARFTGIQETASSPADYSFDSIGDYPIKYITTGGYPVFEYGPLGTSEQFPQDERVGTSPLAELMIRLASEREDAVALIDHTNNPNRTIYETDRYSVVRRVRDEFTSLSDVDSTYGTMFTPWFTCTNPVITGGSKYDYEAQMPGSLAFLSALAVQLKNYNPWLAVSGVVRGQVPYCGGLHTNFVLSNNVADSYQMLPGDTSGQTPGGVISINPITYIRNYGYCIWGNRTLRNNAFGTKATSFLNIRDLVSDIKKQLYNASRGLLFEQNTDVLWINFKSQVTPLLETMKANYILDDYTITKYNINPDTGERIPAYKVFAIIRIVPVNSVEVFELQIHLENEDLNLVEA